MELFTPQSTNQSQVYGVQNLQRVEIDLSAQGLFQGIQLSSIEGDHIFVERCDYPVVVSFNANVSDYRQSFVAREGDTFDVPFRGLNVSGPAGITFTIAFPPKLVLLIGKGCSKYGNEYTFAQSRFGASTRIVTSSAVQQTHALHVPNGVRRVYIEMAAAWTTLTSPPRFTVQRKDIIANVATVVSLTANGQAYAGALQQGVMQYNAGPVANSGLFIADNVVVPDEAAEIWLDWQGTGLAIFQTVRAVWS